MGKTMNVTSLSVSLNRVNVYGKVVYVSGPQDGFGTLKDVRISLASSNISTFGNASSALTIATLDIFAGSAIISIENTTLRISFTVLWLILIASMDARMNFTLNSGSAVTGFISLSVGIATTTASVLFMTNITSMQMPVSLFVLNSAVKIDASSFVPFMPFALALIQLTGIVFVGDAGNVSATVSSSTVRISQTSSLALDICAIFGAVDVVSPSSGGSAMFLQTDRQSVLQISCVGTAALMCILQSPTVMISLMSSDCSIQIQTSATLQASFSQIASGSFLVMGINSTIASADIAFRRCQIQCGYICQVMGIYAISGPFYPLVLVAALLQDIPDCVAAGSSIRILLHQSSPLRSFSPLNPNLVKTRPMFSFAGMTNSTIEILGPVDLYEYGFSSILDSSNRAGSLTTGPANQLLFRGCEKIRIFDSSGSLVEPEAAISAPMQVKVTFVQSDGKHPCPLTASITPERTVSYSRTVTPPPTHTNSKVVISPKSRRTLSKGRAALADCVALAVVLSTPSAGALIQTQHAQLRLASCPDGSDDGTAPPPDFSSSPTRLRFGDTDESYDRGAVIGNSLLVLAVGVLFVIINRFLPSLLLCSSLLAEFLPDYFGIPGVLYAALFMLLVPTVTSATTLLVASADPGDVVIGALVGIVVFAVGPVGYLLLITTTWFGARPIRVPILPKKEDNHRFPRLWKAYASPTRYVNVAKEFMERYDFAGISAYATGRQWFIVVEQLFGIVTGALAGMSGLASLCRTLNILQVIASTMFLASILILKPYGSDADRWYALANSCMITATAFLLLFGTDASLFFSVVQLVVTCVYTAGHLLLVFSDRLWLQRHAERHAERFFVERTPPQMTDSDLRQLLVLCPNAGSRSRGDVHAALGLLIEVICRQEQPSL